ncbi:unannotated protein [freshwater metagenome]|uniref:Unannotated protein n=1 Tax=freshwater metagenome TaxID=449393 RepID=A0A6J7CX63_9ZZZZ|nr:hypothetical protein [Actinomycetota bacterium]
MSGRSKQKVRQKAPQVARAARRAEDVCLQCGMCCDGTLFPGATIDEAEISHVTSLSLTVRRRPTGEVEFEQPCPAFVGGCCSVYEHRPSVCHKYSCRLLPEYTSGRMGLDDCLDIVETMRGLVRWLEEAMGIPIGSFSAAQLSTFMKTEEPAYKPESHQDLMAAGLRFSRLVTEYFDEAAIAPDVTAAGRSQVGRAGR